MKTLTKISALALITLAAASCGSRQSGKTSETTAPLAAAQEVTNVSVALTRYEQVPQSEVYSANVQAYVVNNVAPQAVGRIKKINVEIGDFVSKGQVLAEMDQSSLEQTKLKLDNDATELARLKQLYEEGGLSKSDYEASELAYNVSRSQYENLLENTVLKSPVSGVVTARNYDVGDMYSGSSPIYTVQQISPVKILVGVSESEYSKLKKGDSVTVEAEALPGRTFAGRVNRIYPTIDPTTHTFTAEVVVDNNDRALRPGMYARVTVTFAVNNSIVIPDGAVVKMQGAGQKSVFVLNETDSTVSSRVITLGRHIGDQYEVLSGLNEGETIISRGHTALKDGDKVNVLAN